jgi:hypothetical protein
MADGLRHLIHAAPVAAVAAAAVLAASSAGCGASGPASEVRPTGPLGAAERPPAPVPTPAAPAPWRSCLLDGPAPCVSAAPVRLDRELLAWSDWIGEYAAAHGDEHPLGVTECRWVAELDQVLLCGSSDRRAMNPPLARAAIYIEVRSDAVIDRADRFYLRYAAGVGGFDLRKDHPDPARPDLLAYYAALDRACADRAALCPDPRERAMRALLERAWAGKPGFVLVTFAHKGPIGDDEVVSHEILHAQYFATPAYRDAIDAYWRGLPNLERATVLAGLAGTYNVNDDELMQNEFQAYVLMSGGERALLGHLVDAHRGPLLERLAARGLAPLAVERRSP